MRNISLLLLSCLSFLIACSDDDNPGSSKTFVAGEFTEGLISPDGEFILTGSQTSSEYQLRSADGNIIWSKALPEDIQLESAALSTNAEEIVIGAQSHLVRLFNKNGDQLWQKEFVGEMKVAISDDGAKVFVTGSSWDTVYCYSSSAELLYKTFLDVENEYRITGIQATPNGERLLVKSNSDVYIIDKNGLIVNRFDIVEGNSIVDAAIAHDGQNFIVSFVENDIYHLAYFNIAGEELWRKAIHEKWSFLAMDALGTIYDAPREGNIMLWNTQGVLIDSIIHDESLSIEVSDSGKRLAVSSFLGLSIIDLE